MVKSLPLWLNNFIDSAPDTWNIDPDLLEEAIKDRIAKTGKKPAAIASL